MDYPHPLELLYKFWYLLVHSDWGDYTVWLDNYAIQCGFQVGHYVVQPPQAMEGKWETICNAGEWTLKYWDVLLALAEDGGKGTRKGGLISSRHFQQAEWKRVHEWMRRPTMHTSVAWVTEAAVPKR